MTTRLTAAALAAVVLGAVIAYGWGPSSAQARTTGLLIMLAGTASLAGVLARKVRGLRRTTSARRPGTAAPVAERIGAPAPVQISAETALPSAETAQPPAETALRGAVAGR